MKAIVHTYLNVRTDAPEIRTDNNPIFYRPGDEITISQAVIGQAFKGNRIWFSLDNGSFVWSGGVTGAEFTLPDTTFETLALGQQHTVLQLAKDYYQDKFFDGGYGVTGVFIGYKQRGGQALSHYSLTFQVERKAAPPDGISIPARLPFRGFAIPTDFVEDDYMELEVFGDQRPGRPGCSISRLSNEKDWGSGAFFAHRDENGIVNHYLITNYHVAAPDLLRKGIFAFDVGQDKSILKLVMPSWQAQPSQDNSFGYLYKGVFHEWLDIALIRVFDMASMSNLFDASMQIDGYLDVINDDRFINTEVTMYGGSSGKVAGKKITAVNSSQEGRIGRQVYKKNELIQVQKMSAPGDSGSPVLQGNKLVGIVVGSDRNNTYLLSAEKIISFFNLTLPL